VFAIVLGLIDDIFSHKNFSSQRFLHSGFFAVVDPCVGFIACNDVGGDRRRAKPPKWQ
jgi:hypothetical protein